MNKVDDCLGIKSLTKKQREVLIAFNNALDSALTEGSGKYIFCVVKDIHSILDVLCDMEQFKIEEVRPKYQKLSVYCKALFPQELRELFDE